MIHLSRFRHPPVFALLPHPRHLALATLLGCAGCAGALGGVPSPSTGEIPALEEALDRAPGDVPTMVRLGAAYRASGQTERARTLLEEAYEAAPRHGGAVLLLGLTLEDLQEPALARGLYESYIAVGKASPLRSRIERRLPLLARRELQAAVRLAVANEARIAAVGPQPRTLAVFPFHLVGVDAELEPLSHAMAEMLLTDLSQTDRLTVLERTRVQLLLDELQLAESGAVDVATAARSGRLLGAERLVQGSLTGSSETEIRLDAALVNAWTVDVAGAGNNGYAAASPQSVVRISESDAMQRLFDLEKRLALRLYEAMGVELTPAERERVNRRPTENLQAILAYGRGLRAADAGDFDTAALHFREAAALDPDFSAAQLRAEEAEAMAAATRESTDDLAAAAAFETRLPVAFEPLDPMIPGLGPRDAAQEVMGTEGYEPPTVVEVIINRPIGGL